MTLWRVIRDSDVLTWGPVVAAVVMGYVYLEDMRRNEQDLMEGLERVEQAMIRQSLHHEEQIGEVLGGQRLIESEINDLHYRLGEHAGRHFTEEPL